MTIALDRPAVRAVATIAIGLTAALILPVLVHLLHANGGPPAGAQLLPIFYAVLVLALRSGIVSAICVALLAPSINAWLTGMPAGPVLPTLLWELTLFAVVLSLAVRFVPTTARFLGPVAFLLAALATRLVLAGEAPTGESIARLLHVSWPGLAMLLAIGALIGARDAREPSTGA